MDSVDEHLVALLGARSVARVGRLQSLWSGYGEVVRYAVTGAAPASVVVKHVVPPRGSGRSHDRKLRSYEVERAWYATLADRCGASCRVARCHGVERVGRGWLFVLEDLDDRASPSLDDSLRWLASFHGTFLGQRPGGLWKQGTYWHLATRPDEHRAMARGPLRDAAAAIDARLRDARFKTLVHGDAKPANFCCARDGRTAAVDFQYVGGGCGMKDVAYLLSGRSRGRTEAGLSLYFRTLRAHLPAGTDADAVEAEWRDLFPWAWADFHRFLEGWAPDWRVSPFHAGLTRSVLSRL